MLSYELTKINSKTVVAAIKGQHPQILKASLAKNADELFVLTVNVSYEFLPEIEEKIIFSKRDIKPEESEEAGVRNMKNYLRNLKEQVSNMTNLQVLTGEIDSVDNNHEVYVPIQHESTLITWTVTILKPSTTILKAQVYLFNSATKNKQSTKIIPAEGLYLHHSGEQVTVELRFLIEQSDKYDNVVLGIEGKNNGKYIVSLEKVSQN